MTNKSCSTCRNCMLTETGSLECAAGHDILGETSAQDVGLIPRLRRVGEKCDDYEGVNVCFNGTN